ncbi:hypothetical protein Tco_0547303, partial [Tanacetum coccineum]
GHRSSSRIMPTSRKWSTSRNRCWSIPPLCQPAGNGLPAGTDVGLFLLPAGT